MTDYAMLTRNRLTPYRWAYEKIVGKRQISTPTNTGRNGEQEPSSKLPVNWRAAPRDR